MLRRRRRGGNGLISGCGFECRKGISSLVLERSEALRADGVAIGIHANGWRALEHLGVAAVLREATNAIELINLSLHQVAIGSLNNHLQM
jgi:2-polyprenyl-6-methoxyphenol hydroxylase-like FAD-dependent oxidoreductase